MTDTMSGVRSFGPELLRQHIHRPTAEPAPDWPESWLDAYEKDEVGLWSSATPGKAGFRRALQNRLLACINMVAEVVPAGGRVLDVAAGQGNVSIVLAALGYRVTWNDLRGELADYVKAKGDCRDMEFIPGDLFDVSPDELGQFDAIVAAEIIEHVAHPDQFIAALARMLTPTGVLILTTPNGRYLRNDPRLFRDALPRFSGYPDPESFEAVQFKPDGDGHIFLIHPDEWASLAAPSGLEVLRVDLFTNPLSNGHMKTEPLLQVLPGRVVDRLESITRRLGRRLTARVNCQSIVLLGRAP